MSTRFRLAVVLSLLAAGAASAAPKEAIPASPPGSLHLTIYNDNFALVREDRTVALRDGINMVRVTGVAAQIDPTSVSFLSLTAPKAVVVREQNYQYDLITPNAILNNSVGKKVGIRPPASAGAERAIYGTLLNPVTAILPRGASPQLYGTYYQPGRYAQNLGGLVVETDSGLSIIRTTLQEGMVVELGKDALPEELISEPQLLWKLETTRGGKHQCRLSYITDLINWKADYIAVVDDEEKVVDLNAWVTIANQSGATYRDASLQLMAGDVRRITPQEARRMRYGYGGYGGPIAAPGAVPRPQFQEQAFFEYHLYSLDGTTTIAHNETKQMTLLSAHSVPVKKAYAYEGGRFEWQRWLREEHYQYPRLYGQPEAASTSAIKTVGVVLEVENSKENHLGIPLPLGKVRVYKADEAGRLQFIGEDQIRHTPRDERIRLVIGNAFDLVGERKRTHLKVISSCEYEETFEITLRNHKDEPVEITVIEHPFASWQVLEKSQDYEKKDAHTIEFTVPVPARGEAAVTYRVRVIH